MQIKNSSDNYGIVTIALHWIIALLIIGLLIVGIYMVRIPISLAKLRLYGWHKEYGLLVLALAIVRMAWRFANITPLLSELAVWERITARTVHWIFYLFMFAMPITGWLVTSAAGLPVSFFRLFVLPNLISPDQTMMPLYQEIHAWLGYGLIAIICLHIAAALKHHFINKDNILRRML